MPPTAKCHPGCPLLDVVAGLVELGYAPFPVTAEKVPLVKWGQYHVTAPTWRVLYNEWLPVWRRASGVGLIAGRPHGLVIVDADDAQSWAWVQAHLPVVRGVKTRRGGHAHFRHPDRGIIGNRCGRTVLTPAPGVKLDVKGLGGYAVGPYSRRANGYVYTPVADWLIPVADLPVLPEIIRQAAEDHPPAPTLPPRPRRPGSDPEKAIDAYLEKVGGVPVEGSGSDDATFNAAVWAKANVPELGEAEFIAAIRARRPEFTDAWVRAKWKSARGSK